MDLLQYNCTKMRNIAIMLEKYEIIATLLLTKFIIGIILAPIRSIDTQLLSSASKYLQTIEQFYDF